MRGFDTTLSLQKHIKIDKLHFRKPKGEGPGSETLKERILTSFLPCIGVQGGGILEIKPHSPCAQLPAVPSQGQDKIVRCGPT